MRKEKGIVIVGVFVLLFGVSFVFAETVTIALNESEKLEVGHYIATISGFPLGPANCGEDREYYLRWGYESDIPGYDKLCFFSNFSSNPIVSGKKMISASYLNGGEGGSSHNMLTALCSACTYYLLGSSFTYQCPWPRGEWTEAVGTFSCEVEFTDWCTPISCDDFPFPQCANGLDDGCGTGLVCNVESVNASLVNTQCDDGNLACDEGWDNCNTDGLNWTDGCELDVTEDPNNCGGCGNVCSSGSCVAGSCFVDSGSTYWSDMNGVVFFEGDAVDLDDYVRLVSGANLNYNITDDGSFFLEVDKRYWMADTTGDNYNFTTIEASSENLINVSGSVDDSPLGVEVVRPSCGDNFTVGIEETIEIVINDPDDLVYGDVTINGEWVMDFDNIINNTIIFNYSFDESGNVGIVVSANNTRGEKSKTTVNVMVVDTSVTDYYVASCIDEPKNFDRFTSSRIKFNASSTRAIKFNSSDGSYMEISKNNLKFNWRFLLSIFDEFGNPKWGVPCVGLGSESCPGSDEKIYAFHRKFPTVNDNKVFLTVSIPDSEP